MKRVPANYIDTVLEQRKRECLEEIRRRNAAMWDRWLSRSDTIINGERN